MSNLHLDEMRILFLRSATATCTHDDPYMAQARLEGYEAFSFSPIEKAELSLEPFKAEIEHINTYDGLLLTSVSTGLVYAYFNSYDRKNKFSVKRLTLF